MGIIVHVSLLVFAIALPLAACFCKKQDPVPVKVSDFLPLILVGVFSSLTLNSNGIPLVEWLVPIASFGLFSIFCRNPSCRKKAKWVTFWVAVYLIGSFFILVNKGEYTRNKGRMIPFNRTSEMKAISAAASEMKKQFNPMDQLKSGFVSDLVGIPTHCDLQVVTPEWHSSITNLFRVKVIQAGVWFPGGNVEEGIEKLVIKPIPE